MAKKCAECGEDIAGQALGVGGEAFHPACFVCSKCKGAIKGGFSKTPDGKKICKDCVPKVVCEICKQNISGAATKVNGKTYHGDCFKCADCKGALSGGFFNVSDRYLCKPCAETAQAAGGSSGAGAKVVNTCRKCKEPITSGTIVTGHLGDKFHDACFKCWECSKPLEDFIVSEDRKFKYQETVYLCKECGDKPPEPAPGQKRTCQQCNKDCLPGPESLHLLDGSSLHWACFVCPGCNKVAEKTDDGESTVGRLLRGKVKALKEGKYLCDVCQPSAVSAPPAAAVEIKKVVGHVIRGTYMGREKKGPREESIHTVRIMEDNKCWLDFSKQEAHATESWHAEGTYTEEKNDDKWEVTFTVGDSPFKVGPAVGKVYVLPVDKVAGDTHEALTVDGIRCPLQVGVPDFELQAMMRHAPQGPAPVAVPTAAPQADVGKDQGICNDGHVPMMTQGSAGVMDRTKQDSQSNQSYGIIKTDDGLKAPCAPVPTEVPEGCYSYEDLRDNRVCEEKGIDGSKKESYLSDAAVAAIFGMDRAAFDALPKWKRDQKKKEHGLF